MHHLFKGVPVFLLAFSAVLWSCGTDPIEPEPPEVVDEEEPDPADPDPADPNKPVVMCAPLISNGYTEKMSYYPGETIRVYFQQRQVLDICRLEVYTLEGTVASTHDAALPATPPIGTNASSEGFGFPAGAEFVVPDLPSGIYLVANRIPFVIKSREPADILVLYASNTANAYAESGGKNLYSSQNRPFAVSFQRPIPLQAFSLQCLKWFPTMSDWRVRYIADIDLDDYTSFEGVKMIAIIGHSEYWTRKGRENFDQFVDGGGHALVLSGNVMWWQVRYSDDGSKLICYKDATADPIGDPLLETINWNDVSLAYSILSSVGAHFPNGGYGLRADKGWDGYKVALPASPLLEGTGLSKGDIIKVPTVEYDGAPITGFDPDGYPILDKGALGFEHIELIGFDRGFRVVDTTPTFIAFQKTSASGIVVNMATTDWCSANGMGGTSGTVIKQITYNAIHKLVNDLPIFSH